MEMKQGTDTTFPRCKMAATTLKILSCSRELMPMVSMAALVILNSSASDLP